MKYYVYCLIDNNEKVFYVGKGTDRRMYIHEKLTLNGQLLKYNKALYLKIKSILDSGGKIQYEKVFESDEEILCYTKEIEKIDEFGLDNLCNLRRGTYITSTSEIISQALKKSEKNKKSIEYKRTPEGRLKHRLLTLGPKNGRYQKKNTQEHMNAIKKSLIGIKKTEEHKKKISEKLKKYKKTKEHKKNISKALLSSVKFQTKMKSLEYKENHRQSSTGKNNARAKVWKFTDSNNNIFEVCGEFRKFCLEHDLPLKLMKKIAFNKTDTKEYSGWKVELIGNKSQQSVID